MDVVRRAVDAVAARRPRVGLVLKADIRAGHDGQLTSKVERLEAALDSGQLLRQRSSHGSAAT